MNTDAWNWLSELTSSSPVAHAIGLLALVCVAGMALGSLKVRGVGLGTAGVLFAGIIAGHFGKPVNRPTLEFVKEFGLILFVFIIGRQLGPGFFAAFRQQGVQLNLLAATMALSGTALAIGLVRTGPVDIDSRCLAYGLRGARNLYAMINAFWEPVRFQIQPTGSWNCVVDTCRDDPESRAVNGRYYDVAPRSLSFSNAPHRSMALSGS